MMTNIYRVVSQTEASYVASQKAEGGQLAKCDVVCNDMVKLHQ